MTDTLLAQYQTIESTSREMLQAAREDNWAKVRKLEALCEQQVTHLKQQSTGISLSPSAVAQKRRIMLAILRHDAQIRSLAEPGMGGLELLFFKHGPGQLH